MLHKEALHSKFSGCVPEAKPVSRLEWCPEGCTVAWLCSSRNPWIVPWVFPLLWLAALSLESAILLVPTPSLCCWLGVGGLPRLAVRVGCCGLFPASSA